MAELHYRDAMKNMEPISVYERDLPSFEATEGTKRVCLAYSRGESFEAARETIRLRQKRKGILESFFSGLTISLGVSSQFDF